MPPWIASFAGDVYLFAISHSAAAMKSSKTFCFFSFMPAGASSRRTRRRRADSPTRRRTPARAARCARR